MTICVLFQDGSNPWAAPNINAAEALHWIKVWSRNYDLTPEEARSPYSVFILRATPKQKPARKPTTYEARKSAARNLLGLISALNEYPMSYGEAHYIQTEAAKIARRAGELTEARQAGIA